MREFTLSQMPTALFLIARSENESPMFSFLYGAVLLGAVAAYIVWLRRYKRSWQQSQARGWRQVSGKFDEGEIVTMRKGRSDAIAGYEVWLTYEYQAEGDQIGLYTLPFYYSEFPTEEAAEECRKLVANRNIIPRNLAS